MIAEQVLPRSCISNVKTVVVKRVQGNTRGRIEQSVGRVRMAADLVVHSVDVFHTLTLEFLAPTAPCAPCSKAHEQSLNH